MTKKFGSRYFHNLHAALALLALFSPAGILAEGAAKGDHVEEDGTVAPAGYFLSKVSESTHPLAEVGQHSSTGTEDQTVGGSTSSRLELDQHLSTETDDKRVVGSTFSLAEVGQQSSTEANQGKLADSTSFLAEIGKQRESSLAALLDKGSLATASDADLEAQIRKLQKEAESAPDAATNDFLDSIIQAAPAAAPASLLLTSPATQSNRAMVPFPAAVSGPPSMEAMDTWMSSIQQMQAGSGVSGISNSQSFESGPAIQSMGSGVPGAPAGGPGYGPMQAQSFGGQVGDVEKNEILDKQSRNLNEQLVLLETSRRHQVMLHRQQAIIAEQQNDSELHERIDRDRNYWRHLKDHQMETEMVLKRLEAELFHKGHFYTGINDPGGAFLLAENNRREPSHLTGGLFRGINDAGEPSANPFDAPPSGAGSKFNSDQGGSVAEDPMTHNTDLIEAHGRFMKYNEDGSSSLSYPEITKLIYEEFDMPGDEKEKRDLAHVMALADFDQTGQLDFVEFLNLSKYIRMYKTMDRKKFFQEIGGGEPEAAL